MSTTTRMSTSASTSIARRVTVAVLACAAIAFSPFPAGTAAGAGPTGVTVAAAPAPTRAAIAVRTALAQRGDPYRWGGAGPNAFDCSGLMLYSWRAAGVNLPRTSRMQARAGRPVAVRALRPGDLVFFYRPVSHVGMYIGNGQIVQAATPGTVVRVVRLAYMPPIVAARRVG